MVALVGDAELDEGNIFEAMLEGWKQGLRNCWWIIDYNRQSLDAVVREGLWERYEQLFKNFGWDVVILKYGSLQQAAFTRAGRRDAAALDRPLPEPALLGAGVPGRRRLAQAPDRRDRRPGRGDAADRDSAPTTSWRALMNNLGGHDLPSLLEAFDSDRPRPADLLHLLHHQGLRPAVRRPQGQSRRPDDAGADGSVPQGDERARRATSGTSSRACAHAGASCRRSSTRVPFAARRAAPAQGAAHRGAGRARGHDPADDVDADRLRRAAQRARPRQTATSPSASSPPRPTSRSRPISAPG